jgi:hypothetical protein
LASLFSIQSHYRTVTLVTDYAPNAAIRKPVFTDAPPPPPVGFGVFLMIFDSFLIIDVDATTLKPRVDAMRVIYR